MKTEEKQSMFIAHPETGRPLITIPDDPPMGRLERLLWTISYVFSDAAQRRENARRERG